MILIPNETILGSIQKVKFVLQTGIATYNPLVLGAGVTYDELEILPEAARLSIAVQETDNGKLYSYRLDFKHLSLRDEVDNLLDKYVGTRSVFVVTDMNDRVYVLGAPGTPCTLSYDADSGTQATDQSIYSINVAVAQTFKALSA